MEIEKLAIKKIVSVGPEDKVSYALSLMEAGRIHQIPVLDGKTFEGMLFLRDIVVEDKDMENTNVSSLMRKNIPCISNKASESDAIKLMIENGVRALPVLKESKLVGILSETDMLRFVKEKFVADDIMSEPVTINESDSVGKAKRLMREHNISRLPVIDGSGKISGTIDTLDMIKISLPKGKRNRNFEKPGDHMSLPDFPIRNIMRRPLSLDRKSQNNEIIEALEKEEEIIITEKTVPVGIVTPKDVLEVFGKKENGSIIQISNINHDDALSKGIIYDGLEKWMEKTGVPVEYAYVYVHRHNIGGRVKYSLHMRMRTPMGLFILKSVDWDLLSCVQSLVKKAQKLIEKKRGKMIDKKKRRGK